MADKKYIYNYENHKEAIGFDFNLSVGDCFTTLNGMQWEIVSARDTLVNVSVLGTGECVSKRLLSVRTLDGKTTDKWLEDFGSFNNHFYRYLFTQSVAPACSWALRHSWTAVAV